MDVSFIIPIYNTREDLLLRCFESILKLENIKYEVLLIDDGSKPFVEQFCKKFTEKYQMFHYFKKSNEGVSAARNYGISKAKGEYLFFIDSDDTILPNNLNKSILDNSVDMIVFDLSLVDEEKVVVWNSFECNSGYIKSKEAILSMMYSTRLNSPCAKLIKRDLIIKNMIYFDKELITGEDADFILSILLLEPSICYINKVVYQYWRTDESSKMRMISNPEKLVDNYEYHKIKKINILDKIEIDFKSKKDAQIALVSSEIKSIFNLAIDLDQEGMLLDLLKEKITKAIRNIELSILEECNWSTKLRYYILDKELWRAMKKIGYIRKIYLALRGLHT